MPYCDACGGAGAASNNKTQHKNARFVALKQRATLLDARVNSVLLAAPVNKVLLDAPVNREQHGLRET
jgi:hypothetical protein